MILSIMFWTAAALIAFGTALQARAWIRRDYGSDCLMWGVFVIASALAFVPLARWREPFDAVLAAVAFILSGWHWRRTRRERERDLTVISRD